MRWVALVVEVESPDENELVARLCGWWAGRLEEDGFVAVVVGGDTPDGEPIVLARACTGEQLR